MFLKDCQCGEKLTKDSVKWIGRQDLAQGGCVELYNCPKCTTTHAMTASQWLESLDLYPCPVCKKQTIFKDGCYACETKLELESPRSGTKD